MIETSGITGIVAYEPADQTLTVRAGTGLGEVHELLAGDGLELPASHFGLAEGTVGGLVATDLADARRGRAGAVRDRILGMTVAGPTGTVTRSGGRVVKNVAGYDLMRLHAGAHGAFGLVTEVTLRLAARPEAHAPFERGFESAPAAAEAAWRVAREGASIGLVAWNASPGGRAEAVWVHEGDREWVEAGARWSADAFGAGEGAAVGRPAPVEARLVLKSLEHVCPGRSNVLVRGSLLPSRLPELARRLAGLALPLFGGHAQSGAAFARLDLAAPDGPATLGAVTRAVEECGGAWRIQGAWTPADGPAPANGGPAAPWGGIETPWALYGRIKDAFDPARVLGPAVYGGRGA